MRTIISIVGMLLLLGVPTAARAQKLELPDDLKLSIAERAELLCYFGKAPLLEKFYLMTSLPFRKALPNDNLLSEYYDAEIYNEPGKWLMADLADLKNYKRNRSVDSVIIDTIDYVNGYICFNGYNRPEVGKRALTYWKFGEEKYLIATQRLIQTYEVPCDVADFPRFYLYDGKSVSEQDENDVIKVQTYGAGILGSWFDLFSVEEHLMIYYAMGCFNIGICYDLPRKGTDIIFRCQQEPCLIDNKYRARYEWQGDGTFLKVGRNDTLIRKTFGGV